MRCSDSWNSDFRPANGGCTCESWKYSPWRQTTRHSFRKTNRFFSTIQNKLHFVATGRDAVELIAQRADHHQPNMGLTSWTDEEVRQADVTVAKNYPNNMEFPRDVNWLADQLSDEWRPCSLRFQAVNFWQIEKLCHGCFSQSMPPYTNQGVTESALTTWRRIGRTVRNSSKS